MMEKATLIAYLHTRFEVAVEGNPRAINVLKDLLVPNTLVKGIRVYEGDPLEVTTALNYDALKELRAGSKK